MNKENTQSFVATINGKEVDFRDRKQVDELRKQLKTTAQNYREARERWTSLFGFGGDLFGSVFDAFAAPFGGSLFTKYPDADTLDKLVLEAHHKAVGALPSQETVDKCTDGVQVTASTLEDTDFDCSQLTPGQKDKIVADYLDEIIPGWNESNNASAAVDALKKFLCWLDKEGYICD